MSWIEPCPEALEVSRRLRAVDRQSLFFYREYAEDGLRAHLRELGVECPSIEWVPDLEEGYRRLEAGGREEGPRVQAWRRAELEAKMRLGAFVIVPNRWNDAETTFPLSHPDVTMRCIWDAAWSEAESGIVRVASRRLSLMGIARSNLRSAALGGAIVAACIQKMERRKRVWRPLLDAYEGGLWVYWVLEDRVLAVPRPAIRVERGRIHSDRGPAVEWPSGERWFFWRGVRVPRRLIEDPASITIDEISAERNVELRRVLLEIYGPAKFLLHAGIRPVQIDDFGTLYRADLPGDEPLVMVKVVNATPEPDGSRKDYFLRVPPTIKRAREAVAWTFGLEEGRYLPIHET